MIELGHLNTDQQATYWVGRVVRDDVALESALRALFEALCFPSVAAVTAPRNFDALLTGCQKMVRASVESLGQEMVDVGLDALQEAKSAHRGRTESAHDFWYPQYPGDPQSKLIHDRSAASLSEEPEPLTRDVASFEANSKAIRRATWRVSGMRTLVSQGDMDKGEPDSPMRMNAKQRARGAFKLTDEGVVVEQI
jgi:hypothetical protein